MRAPAGPTGTSSRPSRAGRAVPALVAAALALTGATPALAQTVPAAPTAAPTPGTVQPAPEVTIGVRQAAGVYTFSGSITPAVAGVQVTIARLGTDGKITGVVSTTTMAGGRYEVLTSLPVGFASYYALTRATPDLPAGRSRLYGLIVNVLPGAPITPTVTLDVRRGTDSYVFSGFVTPARGVPLRLVRLVGGRQVTVISSSRPSSAYAFGVPVGPGTHYFQVLTGAANGLAAAKSRVYGLVVPRR